MTVQSEDICALCHHFKMKEYLDHARVGLGRCTGYDGTMAPLINPFVPWSKPACVRYTRPANKAERVAWVEKRQAKQQQTEIQTKAEG